MLLVEDFEAAALMLEEVLELLGHDVEVAYCGRDGLAKARAMQPDVVISDLGLPDIDGCVVAETLRADPALRTIPLIALTARSRPEDVARSKRAGFDHHLVKPAPIEVLNALIRELAFRDDGGSGMPA